MTTLPITGHGTVTYDGSQGDVDVFDFNTDGPTLLKVADYDLRQSAPGVLDLTLRGSANVDRVQIQMTGPVLDASQVAFDDNWTASDLLILRDTGTNSDITGSSERDRIEVSGGQDQVDGRGGRDLLVVDYGERTGDFKISAVGGPGAPPVFTLSSGGGPSVSFTRIERLDITLGSGDDDLSGLGDRDVLRGGGGSDTLWGSGGDDRLLGQGGADDLHGGSGSDRLDGGGGDDTMAGGAGNDTYTVDSAGDEVEEQAGGGIDTLRSTRSIELGGTGVENAVLLGGANRDVEGSGSANRIVGNDGENQIEGLGNRDRIVLGGDGSEDTVVFSQVAHSTGTRRDLVTGFDAGEDNFLFDLSSPEFDSFTGVAVSVRSGGALNGGSFNADIAAALNGSLTAGGANQAILWDPTSGNLNLPGHKFLVIDVDNDGSYSAGDDYVIELAGIQGTLGVNDFLFIDVL